MKFMLWTIALDSTTSTPTSEPSEAVGMVQERPIRRLAKPECERSRNDFVKIFVIKNVSVSISIVLGQKSRILFHRHNYFFFTKIDRRRAQ